MRKLTVTTCAAVFTAGILAAVGVFAAEERGFLGVFLGPIPEPLAIHTGLTEGSMIESVSPDSPAEKAGLRRHDIVTALNGEKVRGPDDLRRAIQSKKTGDTLTLEVRRGADTLKFEATLKPLPSDFGGPRLEDPKSEGKKRGFLGVGFAEVPDALAAHLELEEGAGVLVGNVWKDSPGAKAGIERNDVIVAMDGHEVKGAAEFVKLLEEKKAGDTVKIDLFHKGKKKAIDVTLGERPAGLRDPVGGWLFDDPRGFRTPYGFPSWLKKGRMTIEVDGTQHSFDLPDGLWKADELLEELQNKIGKFREFARPEEWAERLKELCDDLEVKLDDLDVPADVSSTESHSTIFRTIEGGYDVTIRDENGHRTVSVKEGDKVHAKDMPYSEIDKLPDEVRSRVEKAARSLGESRPIDLPREGRIRA